MVEASAEGISIHAPLAGRDIPLLFGVFLRRHFNPRAPCGARLTRNAFRPYLNIFQSTRPLRGATKAYSLSVRLSLYFNPRAPCGARPGMVIGWFKVITISIHAPLAGRDARIAARVPAAGAISIHAPLAGRDLCLAGADRRGQISIHAPLAGRDVIALFSDSLVWAFQSTRPLRGATRKIKKEQERRKISIHAPLAGRDLPCPASCTTSQKISIHAPLAGRDFGLELDDLQLYKFQSTRPLRGATDLVSLTPIHIKFQSTRPLRGATSGVFRSSPRNANFNPRAPCGARPSRGSRRGY